MSEWSHSHVDGVDLRVPHPVPLAVEHVVADLHVVEDLGQREARRTEPPGGAALAGDQDDPTAQLERSLDARSPDGCTPRRARRGCR